MHPLSLQAARAAITGLQVRMGDINPVSAGVFIGRFAAMTELRGTFHGISQQLTCQITDNLNSMEAAIAFCASVYLQKNRAITNFG